jgi:hypothetical protein
VAPILFFIIRYFYLDKAWLFNTDLFFAASLALSALAVPTVITRPTDDDDDVCLRSPGAAILHAQRMNLVVSALLCVWTWARMGWGIGHKPQYHEDYLCVVPFSKFLHSCGVVVAWGLTGGSARGDGTCDAEDDGGGEFWGAGAFAV